MNLSIGNLFPTPLGRCKFEGDIPKTCIDYVRGLEKVPNAGNFSSKNKFLFKKKELKPIYDFCLTAAQAFFTEIVKPSDEISLYITQSWANYSTKGNWHHAHSHGNSYISGVIYLGADPAHDKIRFLKQDNPFIIINPVEYNLYNSPTWWMEAEVGVCYLFPSHLKHEVDTIQTEGERISISFNTFLKGNLGAEKDATLLKL